MTSEDKRQGVRAFVNIPVDIVVQDHFYHGWVKNMDTGGVFIKVKWSLSVGQDISFYFLGENKFATVIRVEPQGIGVKFR